MKGFIAFVLVVLALTVEYAFSDGGVLRWLASMTAPAPAPEPVPAPRPASTDEPDVARPGPTPPQPATQAAKADAPRAIARSGELPVSSSFEDEEMDWAFDARGGDGMGGRSGDGAHSGSFSLFSQATDAANRGWPGWHDGRRYAVDQGKAYVFRAYAASPDGANGWLDLQLYDKAGTWLGGRSTGCTRDRPGAGGWQLLELRFVSDDPKVASVQLALLQCLNHSKGRATTLYFDDMSFGPQ